MFETHGRYCGSWCGYLECSGSTTMIGGADGAGDLVGELDILSFHKRNQHGDSPIAGVVALMFEVAPS